MSSIEIEVSETPSAHGRISFEEFLCSGPERHAEWVDGEVIEMSPASMEHQDLVSFLISIFRIYLDLRPLGRAFVAPYVMRLGPGMAGREPDVLFIANEHLNRIKTNYLDGPADLTIEVVSPESRGRDRGQKHFEYERAGVREYWLIDPERGQTEFYGLNAKGLYQMLSLETDGRFVSRVVEGMWVRPEWFTARPLPSTLGVLREWGLV